MKLLPLSLAGAALALAGCGGADGDNEAATERPGQTAEATDQQTIAAGLDQNSRFLEAAKAAGLDATLGGPGPYTVLVATDEAFGKLPQGRFEDLTKQENRAQLTRILTYHILPGTVLAEDIDKAIENSNGTAVLATMGGETLTARREDGRLVLSDAAGNEAIVTQSDIRRANGVVHQIDTLLVPAEVAQTEAQAQQD